MHAQTGAARETETSSFEAGDLMIDLGRQRVTRAGQEIFLPKLSFDLLLALIRAAPNIATLDVLMQEVWPTVVVGPETLSQRVKLLRDALQDDSREPKYIETVRSRGYRFMQPVVRVASQAEPSRTAESPVRRHFSRQRVALVCATLVAIGTVGALLAYLPEKENTVAVPAAWTHPLPANTVAVLPFHDANAEPGGESVAFGIEEGLLHRLSSVRNLTLIARASSFAAAQPSADAREIGRRLNARYLIEGSVQRAGQRLRITAQLIDADTAVHVWSLRFDRRVDDVFAMEDEITQSVAQALQLTLTEARHPYARFGTEAYLAFLHGRSLLTTRKTADAEAAIKQFERVIAMAPDFAMAYVSLADAYINRASLHSLYPSEPIEDAMRRAGPLAAKAVELDDRLGEAYVLRGVIKSAAGDTKGAESDFRKGLDLAPSYGQGFEQYSEFLQSDWRRYDEALVAIDRARLVDPLRPRNHYVKGRMLAALGDFRAAEELFLQTLEIAPDYYPALVRLGEIRWEQGQFAAAVKLGERAVAIEPQMAWTRPLLAEFYLDSGDEDAALAVLADQAEPSQWLSICMFSGGEERVASLYLGGAAYLERLDLIEEELVPYAIRDVALATHRQAEARDALQERLAEVHLNQEGAYRWGTMVALAQLQKLFGQREDARALARGLLDQSTAHLPHRIVYGKPAAYALLEQHDAALAELEANVNRGYMRRWWYTFEHDPVLRKAIGEDPRFATLSARVRQHASAQRRLIEAMRERGEIPDRKSNGKSVNNPC